jgi:hypothetical protein
VRAIAHPGVGVVPGGEDGAKVGHDARCCCKGKPDPRA